MQMKVVSNAFQVNIVVSGSISFSSILAAAKKEVLMKSDNSVLARREAIVRVGPMVNIAPLLKTLDCDPAEVFEAAGLTPEYFENSNNRVRYSQADDLLRACADRTGCEHFGLLLGSMSEPWHLGLPGLAVYAAPSLEDGLRSMSELLDLHDQAARTYLEVRDGQAHFSFFLAQMNLASIDQAVDLAAANMLQIIRTVCGARWQPGAVWLPRRAPESIMPYERFFHAPVYFDSAELSVSFDRSWLDYRPETANLDRYSEIRLRGDQLHEEQPQEFVDTLQTAIRRAILTGTAAASDVAANLGVHERTLHRRLTAIGSNFRHELDAVRQCFSEQLLEATNMPVAEIAITLGYAHTSSFIRAFERWCDESPAQWRKRQRRAVATEALI